MFVRIKGLIVCGGRLGLQYGFKAGVVTFQEIKNLTKRELIRAVDHGFFFIRLKA